MDRQPPTPGVTLAKVTDGDVAPSQSRTANRHPRYPLVTHRDALRRNDLQALASAIVILGNYGGTAYVTSIVDGSMITICD